MQVQKGCSFMGSNGIKVLVLCADGVATSTITLVALRDAFEEMDVPVDFSQGRIADAAMSIEHGDFDFIISTAGTDLDIELDIPIMSGVPFLTGIGREQTLEQIKEIVNNKK
jgi:PTS system galactitol-specific IIB component